MYHGAIILNLFLDEDRFTVAPIYGPQYLPHKGLGKKSVHFPFLAFFLRLLVAAASPVGNNMNLMKRARSRIS